MMEVDHAILLIIIANGWESYQSSDESSGLFYLLCEQQQRVTLREISHSEEKSAMKRITSIQGPSSDQLTTNGEQKRGAARLRLAVAIALWIIGAAILGAACVIIHNHPMPWPVELTAANAIQGPHHIPCVYTGQPQTWIDIVSDTIDILNGPVLGVLIPIVWMIGMMLFRCIRQALFLGSAVLTAGGLWLVLELLVARPRPVTAEGICIHRIVPAYSFPSGHVMHDVVLYGFLLYLSFSQPVRAWRYRWVLLPLQVLAVLYMLAVGYSRLESGEHWLFDVLGGYLAAILWLFLFIFLYRWISGLLATRRAKQRALEPAR